MAKATVYYEYDIEGNKAPKWYLLHFGSYSLDWSKNTLYIPIEAPFQMQEAEDFSNQTMSLTVSMGELIRNPDKPHHFGINLSAVKKDAENRGVDVEEVEQFIFLIGDIEEIMQVEIFADRI
jgi:hypothetical protein